MLKCFAPTNVNQMDLVVNKYLLKRWGSAVEIKSINRKGFYEMYCPLTNKWIGTVHRDNFLPHNISRNDPIVETRRAQYLQSKKKKKENEEVLRKAAIIKERDRRKMEIRLAAERRKKEERKQRAENAVITVSGGVEDLNF